jgi:hypothetical protein
MTSIIIAYRLQAGVGVRNDHIKVPGNMTMARRCTWESIFAPLPCMPDRRLPFAA